MLIYAIDDEPRSLQQLHSAIAEAAPDADIRDFALASDALHAIRKTGAGPRVVFTDIEMPPPDGLAFAAELRTLSPDTRVVFVTGHGEYALDAFRVHASGYILKPVRAERIREELDNIAPVGGDLPDGLFVRCFGSFEVFWNGRPLQFRRRRTRELLAFLIDRRGGFCTAEEIASTLWEDAEDMSAAKHRLRQLVSDLKNTLAQIGMEDVLIRRSGQLAIARDRVDCDYFRMLDRDARYVGAFTGEYMSQYSWAELTTGQLQFLDK